MCLCEFTKLSEIQNDLFVDLRLTYWCPMLVDQHGISIQSSIKLHETCQKITKKWYAGQNRDSDRLHINVFMSHFSGFLH